MEKVSVIFSEPVDLLPWRVTEGPDGYTIHIEQDFAPLNWVEVAEVSVEQLAHK